PTALPQSLVLVLKETESAATSEPSAAAPRSDAAAATADDVASGDIGARVLRTLPQWLSSLSSAQASAVVAQSVDAALAMP
ncbi:hypothetical protein U2087_15700, partial [Listeria monocytogenes]|uniref:hypothetical protein n=1 Tax=Listeria monocytogenes TaxID=1639 RepID=UPI002FDBC8FA